MTSVNDDVHSLVGGRLSVRVGRKRLRPEETKCEQTDATPPEFHQREWVGYFKGVVAESPLFPRENE